VVGIGMAGARSAVDVPIGVDPYRALFVLIPFFASLDSGEAVLRFPYDDRLRLLLRAIPGRRWDAGERAWRIPLDPERAEALARLLAGLPGEPQVSEPLNRAITRRRARRRAGECVVDVARPDENWWLSFPTDISAELLEALTEHPDARTLPAIGRAMIPLDERSERLVSGLLGEGRRSLRLTEDASHALTEIGQSRYAAQQTSDARRVDDRVDSRPVQAEARRERAARWNGTIEVAGEREAPVFLLLGELERLPDALRERAASAPGGVTVPLTLESWRLIDGQLHGWISKAARRCVAALREGESAPPAVLERSSVHEDPTFVLAPGHDRAQLDEFAALAGATARMTMTRTMTSHRRSGVEHARLPAIRADPFCVPELDRFLAAHGTWVDPEALTLLQEIREQHAHAEGLVALSAATEGWLEVAGLGGELKPFQRAGVSYLLAQRRAFLADEQGLGKTIEALAALQADGDDAYPAVVVCPASLKLNWLREIERWLPGRSARALTGTGFGGGGVGAAIAAPGVGADITVVNYDIVAARLDELRALSPRALVLDESHYCKNATAKRTQATRQLAETVPADGLVLALTGTPVMNRPQELISQLRIIGRLSDFGSGAQFGRRFRGPDAYLRLHWHLRSRCYVRRLKTEVLPQLPPKTRAVVPVELDNEHEYRLAESDVIAWLQSKPLDLRQLDAKVAAALRAERLVRLNALKLLAARGKLAAALAWIHDFCSSGERLVVFAKHREIQRAVFERFPRALHILGEDSHAVRDESLREFQAPDDGSENQLIVCSIEVAGQGLTLTRSSNVVFLELDWTPAKHDQAEDRCHRIGQQDAVNATYLLAAGTIDETIATLLERKRAVIEAVTDGREQDEEGVVDALVRELTGEPYRALRAVA
jgi:SWI/SNF-related matrix-associated actin-dependent regulator of chromatin subfamily A-like protein 1